MMRVGFTGTRWGMTGIQRVTVKRLLERLVPGGIGGLARHGLCYGADNDFHTIVRQLGGWRICGHPPSNPKSRVWLLCDELWPEKNYFIRNHDIVDNVDRLIGCPGGMEEELRSGTWECIRYARRVGRRLYIIWPNGNVDVENV